MAGTRRVVMPDGKFLNVSDTLSREQVQTIVDGIRTKQQGASPAPAPHKAATPHTQGWGEWAAEAAPSIGAGLGGLAAGATELFSGGLATPAALAMPAAGAALGEGVRDYFRHQRGDSRASTSVGEELGKMGWEGVKEGAMSAALPGASKVLGAAGRGLRRGAVRTMTSALNPEMRALRGMPGASLAGGLVKKAEEMGTFALDNGIKYSKKGFDLAQQIVDNAHLGRTSLVRAAKQRGRTAIPLQDIIDPAQNPELADIIRTAQRNVSGGWKNDVQSVKAAIQNISEHGALTRPIINARGKATGRAARVLDPEQLQEVVRRTASRKSPKFGLVEQSFPEQLDKAFYTASKNALDKLVDPVGKVAKSARALPVVQGKRFSELGQVEHMGMAIRNALLSNQTKDELAGMLNLPSAYLAYAHPGLAAAGVAMKIPGLTRRAQSIAAHSLLNPASRAAGKTGAFLGRNGVRMVGDTARRGLQASLAGPDPAVPTATELAPEDIDALYEQYLQQAQQAPTGRLALKP